MRKFKLILTICLVAVLTLTMGVATFANDPLTEGGEKLVRLKDDLDWDAVIDYLSESQWEQVRFYKNGICFKAVIDYEQEDYYINGYYVNIYNANDKIIPDISEEEIITDLINDFDYIVMPYTVWLSVANEGDFGEEDIIHIESNDSILGTFSAVPGFMISIITPLITLFWVNGSFTFIGVLALASLAFALIFLLFTVIRKFIAFRG